MEEKIGQLKYLVISVILCLVLIFNFLNWSNQIIGLGFGLIYLLFYSFIFGSIFINKKGWQIIFGLLFLFALIAVLGAVAIYFYELNDYLFILLILLIPLILVTPYYLVQPKEKFSLKKTIKKYLDKFDQRREPKTNFILVIAYLALISLAFAFLIKGQTTESIQAPWQVVSSKFLPVYFLSSFVLLTYLFRSRRTKLPLILLVIHTFLSSTVALLVYKIGYGFDPFIHQATERIIAQTGTIWPKPLYYLGQYAIVVFFHKLTTLDIALIDRILVPSLFSLFLPTIIFYTFSHWVEKKFALILALAVLVIPYSGFIMTAPQNLANLIFILTIILSLLYYKNQISPIILYLLTLATIAIHPMAGIPLLIAVFLLNLFKFLYTSYIKYLSLYFFSALVFVIFLPLAFISNGSTLNLKPVFKLSDFKWFGWIDKFDLPLNLVYLVNANKIILASLIIIIGLVYLAKNKLLKNNAGYLMAALIIVVDFVITKYFLAFPDLQDYDKNFFVARLAIIAFYILLPFFLLGLYFISKKLYQHDFYTRLLLILVLAGSLTISLYLSYPRLNQYEPAKFFSVSASDIKAVDFIEKSAAPNHLVLANQMIGVTAIKEFGFKKYYNNQFYYSMPMGSPRTFYEYYLEMIYQGAKRETMEKAMNEAGVTEAYFVLNQYWNNSTKIAKQATESADKIYDIDNGKIYIFKYVK
ncbi:MAG: hypothetical protein WC675_01940 [Patescibacteria group bacterium]|jgi:hypothetical protein